MLRLRPISVFTVLMLAFFPPLGKAQDFPQPPAGSSAEIVEKKVTEEAKDEVLEEKTEEAPGPEKERPTPSPGAAEVRTRINRILLRGELILPLETFEPLLGEFQERELAFRDFQVLISKIEDIYRTKGYFAVVYLPPQRIEAGEVTLEVLVARMGTVEVEGHRYSSGRKIRSYWKIPKGETLLYDRIRESMIEMNQNPDRLVRSVLHAGKEAGTTDVTLKVEERFPTHLGYTFDNQGVKLTGKERTGFTFRHNNLLRLDDIFLVGTVFGQDFGALFLQHLIPLNSRGTRLALGFTHAQVNPQKEFKLFGINGISQNYSLALRQRLLRNDRFSLETYLGFDFKEKRTRVQSVTSAWDRLRVLSPGIEFQARDKTGVWSLGQDFAFGFSPHGDGFPLTSRAAESRFFKYGFYLNRQQKLFRGTRGVVQLKGQLSPDKLTPQEEIFMGGASTVRGYPESDYLADQGILTNVEFWTPFFLAPKAWRLPLAQESLREQIQLVSFLDYGYGRLTSPGEREHSSRTLLGIGAGFQIRFRKYVSARLEWGVPLKDDPLTESGSSQFHFRLKLDI